MSLQRTCSSAVLFATATLLAPSTGAAQEPIRIGLNYPKTGPYAVQGLDQLRAAELALHEINEAGGILGHPVEMLVRDTKSKPAIAAANARELIEKHGVRMVFGGSSSGVAVATGEVAQELGVPFFGTLTYATGTTGVNGHRFTFRECYDSWAAAKVLSDYMNEHFSGKKFLYITADYNWGHSTEAAFRELSGTEDAAKHRQIKTPFPGATDKDFRRAMALARVTKPDVIVMVLFGNDMVRAVRMATSMGLKNKSQIVVPNLTLGMAEGGGAKVMEGVVGALPWTWRVPEMVGSEQGKHFVSSFAATHNRYPSTSGASAYTILHEFKAAAERAHSLDGAAVVAALEGHEYTLLKDKQIWRSFDHQSVQSVYAVRCKSIIDVNKDQFKLDYFDIIGSISGKDAFISHEAWVKARTDGGKPPELEAIAPASAPGK